jgi:hypothetical protein
VPRLSVNRPETSSPICLPTDPFSHNLLALSLDLDRGHRRREVQLRRVLLALLVRGGGVRRVSTLLVLAGEGKRGMLSLGRSGGLEVGGPMALKDIIRLLR